VSEKSASVHVDGRHLFTLSQYEKDYIISKIKEQGYDYERLAASPYPRAAFNIKAFQIINDELNRRGDIKFAAPIQELF
jgi:hypothetical protein